MSRYNTLSPDGNREFQKETDQTLTEIKELHDHDRIHSQIHPGLQTATLAFRNLLLRQMMLIIVIHYFL